MVAIHKKETATIAYCMLIAQQWFAEHQLPIVSPAIDLVFAKIGLL